MFELSSTETRPRVTDREIQAPPHAVESEMDVLASVLFLGVEALIQVIDRLAPDDFYRAEHRLIYQAALELKREDAPVTSMTVAKRLKDWKKLDQAGGVQYVTDLACHYSQISSLNWSADQVLETAQKRSAIKLLDRQISAAYDSDIEASQWLAQTTSSLQEIASRQAAKSPTALHDLMQIVYDKISDRYTNGITLPGNTTGWTTLDDFTGGWVPGEVSVIAGRSSMGKSAFMISAALNVLRSGKPVVIFSAETRKESLVMRLMGQLGRIAQQALRFAKLTSEEFSALAAMMGEGLPSCEIFDVRDDIGTPAKMEAKLKRLMLQGLEPGVVFIDHLHELDSDREYKEERQKYSQVCSDIRDNIAQRMNVPVALLAQLSRAVEARQNKRPELHDLRESGDIEQKADVVLMLYRDEYYNPNTEARGEAEVLIRKCRDGARGTCHFYFSEMMGIWTEAGPNFVPRAPEPPPKYKKQKAGVPAHYSSKEN